MNYLTNYYKNLCEKLEKEINFIQEQLHSSIDNPKKSDLGTLISGKSKGMQPESTKSSKEVKPTYPEEEKEETIQEARGMKKALKHGHKYPQLLARAAEAQKFRIGTQMRDLETLGMEPKSREDTESAAAAYTDLIAGRVSPKESRATAKTLSAINPINDDPDQPKTEGDYYYDKAGSENPERVDNMLSNLHSLQILKLKTDRKKKKKKK